LSGSIGGTLLETTIATINITTIIRLLQERARIRQRELPAH
jgi:DNA-binding IscR family transcriptional regulator